MNIDSHWCSL